MMNAEPKFYPYPDWENDSNFTFLGSERNPNTKRCYDIWIYQYPKSSAPGIAISLIARHSTEPSEYGSSPICTTHYDRTHFGEDFQKDFIWGMERAYLIGLYYLATGERPYIRDADEIEWMLRSWEKEQEKKKES